MFLVLSCLSCFVNTFISRFGNSDSAAAGPLNVNSIVPMSLIEFLWNLHILLSRPRAQDLTVDELYDAYFEMFAQECPLASWLVVDPASGGIYAALRRIPHVVEQYKSNSTTSNTTWFIRAANPPSFTFAQLREVDDAYKIRLQQIAAGQIPIEDLADSSGITGMLFGLDRVTACVNVLQAIIKILLEKSKGVTGMDLGALELEFQELFKIPLDVFHLLSQRSLLQFLAKFRPLYNLYNDGISWKILLQEGWDMAVTNMENLVRTTILVQPKQRRVVRLSGLILPPVKSAPSDESKPSEETKSEGQRSDSVAALVSLLQGFQKPAAPPTASEPTNSVSAQIQQLLQKKKQQTEPPSGSAPASGNALNELMAALQAAKNK